MPSCMPHESGRRTYGTTFNMQRWHAVHDSCMGSWGCTGSSARILPRISPALSEHLGRALGKAPETAAVARMRAEPLLFTWPFASSPNRGIYAGDAARRVVVHSLLDQHASSLRALAHCGTAQVRLLQAHQSRHLSSLCARVHCGAALVEALKAGAHDARLLDET